jgi:beta-lactamase superfamily II metal-dependent hydrolase
VSLLAGVLSSFGLNTPTAPTIPLGALVWGVFREIETATGLTPVAGTPTAGNTVIATIDVGHRPAAVAVSPTGSLVYVANNSSTTL